MFPRQLRHYQCRRIAIVGISLLVFILFYIIKIYTLSEAAPFTEPKFTPSEIIYTLAQSDSLKTAGQQRIVVSLSSFAGRTERVNATLQSLLQQSMRPDVIYLSVPEVINRLADLEETKAPLPGFLAVMEKRSQGRLKILRPKDYGPSTKLLGALEVEGTSAPNTIIITVDDDVIYHRDTVLALSSFLVHASTLGIPRIAPCFDCEVLRSTLGGGAYRPDREGVCPGWLGAYAASAYYTKYFANTSVFTYDGAPDGCRLHDDVWISGVLWREKQIRPYLIRPGFGSVVSHRAWDHLAIHSVKNTESWYRDPCINYFDGLR